MVEILLMRHGETSWNIERRIQGHRDIPLNKRGKNQSISLAKVFEKKKISSIYSSDLKRASETALQISKVTKIDVDTRIGLRERCFGLFEGLKYDEIINYFPKEFKAWRSRNPNLKIPYKKEESETLIEFYNRSIKTIIDIFKKYENERIAVITHGGVLDCMFRLAKNKPLIDKRDFPLLNASINSIVWNGNKFFIKYWADISHLGKSLDEIDIQHPIY